MTDNFAGYPESLGELRNDSNAALWTPREALISVLRDIDSGKVKPDALVVCFRETTGKGETDSYFRQASPDVHVSLGLISFTAMKIVGAAR
jgi:hypothetical protein